MVADRLTLSSLPRGLFLHAPALFPILHDRPNKSEHALGSFGVFPREAPAAAAEEGSPRQPQGQSVVVSHRVLRFVSASCSGPPVARQTAVPLL